MTGSWEVYCSSARLISLEVLQRRFAHKQTHFDGDMLVFVLHDTLSPDVAEIEVSIDRDADEVNDEAVGLAGRGLPIEPGVPPPSLDRLRAADARYVIEYDTDAHDMLVNMLIVIGSVLVELCDGVIYDRSADRFP